MPGTFVVVPMVIAIIVTFAVATTRSNHAARHDRHESQQPAGGSNSTHIRILLEGSVTFTLVPRSYALKSWLVGSLAHLDSPIEKCQTMCQRHAHWRVIWQSPAVAFAQRLWGALAYERHPPEFARGEQ